MYNYAIDPLSLVNFPPNGRSTVRFETVFHYCDSVCPSLSSELGLNHGFLLGELGCYISRC
jgi:hypothetical protein